MHSIWFTGILTNATPCGGFIMAELIYPTDAELQSGKVHGEEERQTKPHATAVRFFPASREFELLLQTGNRLAFPASALHEIAQATDAQLAQARLLPGGDVLVFDELDLDFDVPGLVMDLVAGPAWRKTIRATLAREMAASKTPAKAAAARENGKKGGRPRKNKQAS